MNWGELWDFPFESDIWGTVWTGFGAVGTTLAAAVAAGAYVTGKRNDKWAQASLVFFEIAAGAKFMIHNESDRPIAQVEVAPELRSLWSAARSGSFDERVIFVNNLFGVSSYERFVQVKSFHKQVKRGGPTAQSWVIASRIDAGDSAEVDGSWVHQNGAKGFIRFVDAQGQSWKYDVEEQQLHSVRTRPSPLKTSSHTLQAASWIVKNQVIYAWRKITGKEGK